MRAPTADHTSRNMAVAIHWLFPCSWSHVCCTAFSAPLATRRGRLSSQRRSTNPEHVPFETVQARKFAGRECTRPFSAQALYNSLDCLGNLWPRLLRTSKAPPRSLTSMSCTHARCAGLMGSQYRHSWVTVFWWRLESLYFPCEAGARRPAGDAAARRLRLSGPPCLGKISPMCPWPASVCQGSKEVTAVPTRIVVQACCFCCLRWGGCA